MLEIPNPASHNKRRFYFLKFLEAQIHQALAYLATAMNLQAYQKHFILMTTTVRDDEPTVRVHAEYCGAVNHNKTTTGDTIVITDSGADTT